MEQVNKIKDESDYTSVMAKIHSLMPKGSQNVSKKELAEITALAAQHYEQQNM